MTTFSETHSDTSFPQLDNTFDIPHNMPVNDWRLDIPAKPACYLLTDVDNKPILLATIGNLRQAITRRFTPTTDSDSPSKRIDYRQITRRIHWRNLFSRFEADLVYLENARHYLPDTFHKMVQRMPTRWITIDPASTFPYFQSTQSPTSTQSTSTIYLGPIPSQSAARKYITLLEDIFNLCRHHDILTKSPNATPCPYKEMAKCPSPCDGSISMAQYYQQITSALNFATQPFNHWLDNIKNQMSLASKQLDFEKAAQLKSLIQRARAAQSPQFHLIRSLNDFRFLSLQSGDGKNKIRAFLIHQNTITFAAELYTKKLNSQLPLLAPQIDYLLALPITSITPPAAQRINLVSFHLLRQAPDTGIFLDAHSATDPVTISVAIQSLISTQTTSTSDPNISYDIPSVESSQ